MSLVLHSKYWQCCIAEENVIKMIFLTLYKQYKWVFMPLGLTNVIVPFTQIMNNLFMDLLDNIVVCSYTYVSTYFTES